MPLHRSASTNLRSLALTLAMTSLASAQNIMHIDATAAGPVPMPVPATLGTNRNPNGDILGVNSQYLTLNGKPWLPVMGEFHFSRYPQAEWEQEILKMKAAGVDIVSTYVIWIHHEESEGTFDWTGQRDLRSFVQLCAKHGMYVYPRIGPWAHAEVRNGGLPDWVLQAGPVRQNDPVYLREVSTFYSQIAAQLHGLWWKDGGPLVGFQIENEYRDTGPGKGGDHIRALKKLAVDDGMDAPLYTVTGWDGASIPLDATLPVFGGYPDAPWDGSPHRLPPAEVYAFRFENRSAGNMGAIGGNGQASADTYRGTPFFTAEIGAGIQDTYFRRPVVSGDDIAAIAPVMLGSGVNLLGYYMFHGGRNPDGGDITLQESQRTDYPTDVPVRSYDFQAPLGEFGQERPSLRKLKLVDYFLEDFGALLAPMLPHAPTRLPSDPGDMSVPRISARSLGDSGFIFFNNYIRGAATNHFAGFQVELALPGGTIKVPEQPIDLAAGSYGIWPVNLQMGDTTLHYATAQIFKHAQLGNKSYFFFFSVPGVLPELLLASEASIVRSSNVIIEKTVVGIRIRPTADSLAFMELRDGTTLVVVPKAEAEDIWRGDSPDSLIETTAEAFSEGSRWTLQQDVETNFRFGIFGHSASPTSSEAKLHKETSSGLFTDYAARVAEVHLPLEVQLLRKPGAHPAFVLGPSVSWRPAPLPFAPEDKDFAEAGIWKLHLPAIRWSPQLADVLLRLRYEGDAARLSSGTALLDDNFFNGEFWEIGLKEVAPSSASLELSVLPMPRAHAMYIEKGDSLHYKGDSAAGLSTAELLARYQLTISVPDTPQR